MLTELIKLADEMDRAGNNDGANKIDAVINSFSKNNLKNKELIDSVLSLADELDAEGMHAFADTVQDFLTKLAEDDEEAVGHPPRDQQAQRGDDSENPVVEGQPERDQH